MLTGLVDRGGVGSSMRKRFGLPTPSGWDVRRGFTLAEVVLGAVVLGIAAAAILGAYVGQITLNEHASNLSLSMQDANRVIERIRQENVSCGQSPTAVSPVGTTWHEWLVAGAPAGGDGLSLVNADERIVVTCQNRAGTAYCPASQMSAEWHPVGAAGTENPLRITVAVCWRHRGRVIGECSWNGAVLTGDDSLDASGTDTPDVVDSPAMLTTLVACRS